MSNHINIALNLETYADPFPGKAKDDMVFIACGRCDGEGRLDHYHTTFGGICFKCNGSKGERVTAEVARKRERGRVQRRNAAERKVAARQEFHNAQMEAAEAAFPVLAAWWEEMEGNNFLTDLWGKAFDYELSEKQIAAAAATIARKRDRQAARQAEKDAAAPAPSGKLEVTGEVVSVKYQDSDFGGAWKMIVKGEGGFKVWATIPAKLWDALEAEADEDHNVQAEEFIGRQVKFTATLEVSDRDESFAFAKRPSKASLVK